MTMNVIPGSIQVLSKSPKKYKETQESVGSVCLWAPKYVSLNWCYPATIENHLLMAVFHVITFSRSYFAYFL